MIVVPGAEAPIFQVLRMSGLKPGPISEATARTRDVKLRDGLASEDGGDEVVVGAEAVEADGGAGCDAGEGGAA